jgi:histidinol-phosphate aminotransferase
MADAGITIGRAVPPMLEWSRVSLGTPEEMGVWAEAMRDFRRKSWV